MKLLRNLLINIFCTFTVLSFLFGILCKINILENSPYADVVFTLLTMAAGTALFVTIRNNFFLNAVKIKYIIDIVGCSAVIITVGYFADWLELKFSYLALILTMVLAVYLLVWLLIWLQSKHDEEDLNRLLSQHKRQDK